MRPDPHPALPALLVIDVGSTRTKLALVAGSRVARIGSFATGGDWEDRLGAALAGRVAAESVEAIAMASASGSPCFAERVRGWWAAHLGPPPPIRVVEPATAPLAIDYIPPSALGADRIADAVAAVDRWGAPVVVVDAGTALIVRDAEAPSQS